MHTNIEKRSHSSQEITAEHKRKRNIYLQEQNQIMISLILYFLIKIYTEIITHLHIKEFKDKNIIINL